MPLSLAHSDGTRKRALPGLVSEGNQMVCTGQNHAENWQLKPEGKVHVGEI